MAEQTFISGVAPGAFEEAFGELPVWASESTAVEIQTVLNKILKSQNDNLAQLKKCCISTSGNKMSPGGLKEFNDELGKAGKTLKRQNDDAPKKKRLDKEEEEQKKKSIKQWGKDLLSWNTLNTAIIGSGAMIKKTMIDNVNTFDELYRSGINVLNGFESASSGFEALSQLTTLTGVRFTELSKTVVKYNTAINSFGLGKFAKVISQSSQNLAQFGFSSKESAELLGTYLESQRGYSDMNAKSQEQVQKDLLKFGERVTRLSQATGILRTKLLEDIEAISQSVEANILAGRIGHDAADSTLAFVASFKDKNLGQAFLKMMTDVIKPLNTTFMDFQKTGFGGFGQKLINFTRSLEGLSPEDAAKRTAEFAKANDRELSMMIQRGALLSQAGIKEADGMMKVAAGLQQQGRAYKEISAEEIAKADATSKASKDLQNQVEKLLASLQAAFAPTIPMLTAFANGLGYITTGIAKLTAVFDPATRGWVGAGIALTGTVISIKLVSSGLRALRNSLFGTAADIRKSGKATSSGIGSSVKGFLRLAGAAAAMLGVVSAVDGAFGLAGVGKEKADEGKDSSNWERMNALEKAESGLYRLIEGAGRIAFLGNLSDAAQANRVKNESSYLDKKHGGISSPSQTTIKSPSSPDNTSDAMESTTSTTESPTERVTPQSTTDINSVLSYQSTLLAQILETSQNLVSVNKDILKYTKVHS